MIKKFHALMFVTALVGVLFLLSSCVEPVKDSRYVPFAKCLREKGVVMYGENTCPVCAAQKDLLGKAAAAEINYVECNASAPNQNAVLCEKEGILHLPTWVFKDGSRNEGLLTVGELADKTGCVLPPEPVPTASGTK